jgi:mannose-6-phosphate isomerase-like protein (cupin superfamily)
MQKMTGTEETGGPLLTEPAEAKLTVSRRSTTARVAQTKKSWRCKNMPLKVMRIEDAPVRVMRWDRGKALRLVDEADGAKNVDVHINLINVDSGPGPTHYHAKAENIYVVLEGNVEAIVEGKKYRLGPGEVAFIPPGVRHQAGNCGDKVARVLEIYAPAGEDFHIVDDSENKPQS